MPQILFSQDWEYMFNASYVVRYREGHRYSVVTKVADAAIAAKVAKPVGIQTPEVVDPAEHARMKASTQSSTPAPSRTPVRESKSGRTPRR